MKVKLLSLNCWLLPRPFAVRNKQRMNRLIALIKDSNPDVVALQEVWRNKYVKYLKRHLPQYHFTFSGTQVYNQSGLVTLSKIKPISKKVSFFKWAPNHNLLEIVGRKGYVITKYDLNGKKFSVVNTHLYTPFFKSAKKICKKQFNFFKKLRDKNIIVAGDFNLELFDLHDINDGDLKQLCNFDNTRCATNPLARERFNGTRHGGNRKIDYVMLKNGNLKMDSKVLTKPLISDHYAISGCIKL